MSLFSSILNNSSDYAFGLILIKYIVSAVMCLILLIAFADFDCAEESYLGLIKIIFSVTFFAALMVILEFFSPYFKSLLNSILAVSDNVSYEDETRYRGLAVAGGASLSLALAMGSMCSVLLYRQKENIFYAISGIIITVSCIFVGRTGLVLSLISTSVLLYFMITSRGSRAVNIILLLAIVVVIFSINIENIMSPGQVWLLYNWSFEFITNYISGNNISTTSTDALANMYHIPDRVFHLIFGAGYFTKPLWGYLSTDVGYIKTINASGLLGFVFFYFGYMYLVFNTLRYIRSHIISRLIYKFILILSGVLLIAELKEPFIYQNYASRIILLLLLYHSVLKIGQLSKVCSQSYQSYDG